MRTGPSSAHTLAVLLIVAAGSGQGLSAQAQTTPNPPPPSPASSPPRTAETYAVAVSRDNVELRSGPGMFYYPVSTLKAATVLQVVGEDSGFLRVAYPDGMRALIKIDDATAGPSGATVKLARPAKLMHANLSGGYPFGAISFDKPPEPGTEFKLLDTVKGADGKPAFYAVAAPAGSTGYVNKDLVRRLTPAEAATARTAAPATGSVPPPAGTSTPVATSPTTSSPATAQPVAAAPGSTPMPGDPPAVAVAPKIDPRTAEVDALKSLYNRVRQPDNEDELAQAIAQFKGAIAKLGSSPSDQRLATNLGKYVEIMEMRLEVRDALARSQSTNIEEKHAKVTRQLADLERNGFYKVIGRLLPSTVYDGTRLPKLYRIVSPEPGAGRTLAYLAPQPGLDLDAKLGRIVGVSGESKMDESLKANLVTPKRVEVLTLTPSGGSEPAASTTQVPTDGK